MQTFYLLCRNNVNINRLVMLLYNSQGLGSSHNSNYRNNAVNLQSRNLILTWHLLRYNLHILDHLLVFHPLFSFLELRYDTTDGNAAEIIRENSTGLHHDWLITRTWRPQRGSKSGGWIEKIKNLRSFLDDQHQQPHQKMVVRAEPISPVEDGFLQLDGSLPNARFLRDSVWSSA